MPALPLGAWLLLAPPEAAASAPDHGPWVLGGFVDMAYQGSNNQPQNHVWRSMYGTPRTNELSLNLGALWVRRDPDAASPFHVELASNVGPAADALVAAEPMPGGTENHFAGPEVWKHLARANTGLRLRTGTDVTVGLMVCPIGLGIFWTPTNTHYTAPWTLNGVPFYLAGGRITQKVGKMVELQGWVVDGWQTLGDINVVPSWMFGLVLTPRDDLVLQQMTYFGAEDIDPSPRAWRTFWNTQLTWTRERIALAGLFDIGRERLTAQLGEPVAMWLGATGDVRWRVLGGEHTWHMAARGGGHWDRDGRMFGVPQWLIDATYTNDFRLFEHILLRIEYRYDHSTAPGGYFYRRGATFDASPELAGDQHTIIGAVTGSFELNLPRMSAHR
jgi:hypothetical protein